jgi:uncharacterized SAM-binding protein YcdF (DUF218 family)
VSSPSNRGSNISISLTAKRFYWIPFSFYKGTSFQGNGGGHLTPIVSTISTISTILTILTNQTNKADLIKPIKFILKILLAVFSILLIIAVFETGFFLYILNHDATLQKADLITVFGGREGRTREAYKLVEQGYAENLMISPANIKQLQIFDRHYGTGIEFKKIIEKKARTTFENALYLKRTISNAGYKSLILVTSWDHIPRSFLLLKIMLFNSDVQIFPYTVTTGKLNRDNWYRYGIGWKMVCNEMIEVWGSLVELIRYHVIGKLPETRPGKKGTLNRIKNMLRFEMD